MRVIARKTLKTCWTAHTDVEKSLRAWFHEAKRSKWKSFQDIKKTYPAADVLPGNRVIFDIKGNNYRLVVKIHYNTGVVFIRFVGTHSAYSRINPATI
jgi:mRNA interferase HigB